jgi:hypothetical protein
MNEGKSESRSDDPAVSLPAIAGRPARLVPVIAVIHRELRTLPVTAALRR